MASILVYIYTAGGLPQSRSLEVLGEGRRIASTLGAALYAYAEVGAESEDCDELVAALGRGGADRVMVRPAQDHKSPALWMTRGKNLAEAVASAKPSIVMLTADDCGHDIGPRLAAELSGAFIAEPAVHYGSHGEVIFSRRVYGGTHFKRLNSEETKIPIVVTLTPGSYCPAIGFDEAEAFFFSASLPDEAELEFDVVSAVEDTDYPVETAKIVVVAGAGLNDSDIALVRELCSALGGEFGGTHSLCQAGHVDPSREIDVSARRVSPQIYIACGASGSAGHLGAVSADAEIVAINSDSHAPIFRVASYGVVGEVGVVLPQLIAAAKAHASKGDA